MVVHYFEDSKVLTSVPWRHSHMKFSDGLETTIWGVRNRLRRLFTPNSLFASMLPWASWVGAPKRVLSPGADTLGIRHCQGLYRCWFASLIFQKKKQVNWHLNFFQVTMTSSKIPLTHPSC